MSTYAIVETGSKQYRVEPQSILEVERFDVPENKKNEVALDKVLLIHDGKDVHIGKPVLAGAKVVCDNLGEFRGKKIISFKFKKRKATCNKKGHRQSLLRLRVKDIQAPKA